MATTKEFALEVKSNELDLSAYDNMPGHIAVNSRQANVDAGSMFVVPRFSGDGIIGKSEPTWLCEELHGKRGTNSLAGTIISYTQYRSFYGGEFTKGARPPDCASIDMENGQASPAASAEYGVGGKCYECPMNFMGAGSCGRRLALFMLCEEYEGPIVVDLPPTSVKPVVNEMQELETLIPVISAFQVGIGFTEHTTKGGREMWRASITPLKAHNQQTIDLMAQLTREHSEKLKPVLNVSSGSQSERPAPSRAGRNNRVAGEVIETLDVTDNNVEAAVLPADDDIVWDES